MNKHTLIHITDLHFSDKTDQALVDMAREAIVAKKPDTVVCTGDLVSRASLAKMETYHQKAKVFIDSLNVETFFEIPGNHDCCDIDGNDAMDLYKKYWPEEDVAANLDGLYLLGINSNNVNEQIKQACVSAGNVNDESIEFIKDSIKQADKDDFRVFCLHHHLIPMYNDTYDNTHNMDLLYNAGQVLRILRENRFDLVLQGHKHDPEMFHLNDTVFLIGGSLVATLPGDTENAFYTIEIDHLVTITLCYIQSGEEKVVYCRPNPRFVPA